MCMLQVVVDLGVALSYLDAADNLRWPNVTCFNGCVAPVPLGVCPLQLSWPMKPARCELERSSLVTRE